MPILEKRYAEAFYQLARQKNAISEYGDELAFIAAAYEKEPGFADFLGSPRNDSLLKKQTVTNIFSGRIQKDTLSFLLLLLEKNRIRYLPDISREFRSLQEKQNNVLKLTVRSAVWLPQEYIIKICEKFKKQFQASEVKASVEIDPALIGSLVVIAGDKQYDGSIKGLLSRLRSTLAE